MTTIFELLILEIRPQQHGVAIAQSVSGGRSSEEVGTTQRRANGQFCVRYQALQVVGGGVLAQPEMASMRTGQKRVYVFVLLSDTQNPLLSPWCGERWERTLLARHRKTAPTLAIRSRIGILHLLISQ